MCILHVHLNSCLIKTTITDAYCIQSYFLSALQNALQEKGDGSLCLSTTSFIFCFFGSICVLGATVICHIPAMLFAAKVWSMLSDCVVYTIILMSTFIPIPMSYTPIPNWIHDCMHVHTIRNSLGFDNQTFVRILIRTRCILGIRIAHKTCLACKWVMYAEKA